jgi:cation:H+ antiporter
MQNKMVNNKIIQYKPISIITINLIIAIVGIIVKSQHSLLPEILLPIAYGFSIFSAALIISWAAESSEKDISGSFVIAIIALIAVLPEYAIETVLAYTAGQSYKLNNFVFTNRVGYVSANVTGANRLLAGFGWPLIMLINMLKNNQSLNIKNNNKLELLVLGIGAISMIIASIIKFQPIFISFILIIIYLIYLFITSKKESTESEFVGISEYLANLPKLTRITTNILLIIFSGVTIFIVSHPFVESLIHIGGKFGIDEYYLIQWLAPLASESPEIIIASLFAMKGRSLESISIILSSQANQMSLLIGSMGAIFSFATSSLISFPLNDTQGVEFLLTSAFALLQISMILWGKFKLQMPVLLLIIFFVQLIITDTSIRAYLSIAIYMFALIYLILFITKNKIQPTKKQ